MAPEPGAKDRGARAWGLGPRDQELGGLLLGTRGQGSGARGLGPGGRSQGPEAKGLGPEARRMIREGNHLSVVAADRL